MANGEPASTRQSSLPAPLGAAVQAHLGNKASRFAGSDRARDWSLFFFFRILPQAEVDNDFDKLKKYMQSKKEEDGRELLAVLQYPAAVNAGLVDQKMEEEKKKIDALAKAKPDAAPATAEPDALAAAKPDAPAAAEPGAPAAAKPGAPATPGPDAPATLFLDWLKVITGADSGALTETLTDKLMAAGISQDTFVSPTAQSMMAAPSPGSTTVAAAPAPADRRSEGEAGYFSGHYHNFSRTELTASGEAMTKGLQDLWDGMREMPGLVSDPVKFKARLAKFGKTPGEAGLNALRDGLITVCFYEILRQIAPAQSKGASAEAPPAAMRSAKDEAAARRKKAKEPQVKDPPPQGPDPEWDAVPINLAFTYSGLKALQLDKCVLASFPDDFKEGMAARAERLGDSGPSAPEHWDGVLGLDRVHGYFTGGFKVGAKDQPVEEKLWETLRHQIRAYNDRSSDLGQEMRNHLRTYFKLLGIDILHIELGQAPYGVDEHGNVERLEHRFEHFGFRDGISQPFVDLDLGVPSPGGGTPRRNRTWSPLAAGEIYLDQPDEDGNCHQFPAHELLRRGSTFLVFRKLEQDVAGFRAFLSKQRPGSPKAQRRLAAQFVGRWQNGTPLVLSPDVPLELGGDPGEPNGLINDFLYVADDPTGLKCPLGAHIRRTNPRDIGGTNDVRRHRILRRGIAYGGPLLPNKVLGDRNKRGLLFICANSRIDLQFEVIQSNWINKGELLGQAGLNRCPLTGANSGGIADAFLEAGAVAPVTGLQRFVITRGGDYFFAPGMEALDLIARGCKFAVDKKKLPYAGNSMGDTTTPSLFSEERLTDYGREILSGAKPVIRVPLPQPPSGQRALPTTVAFVGQFEDVRQVLSMRVRPHPETGKSTIIHSVAQYRSTVERMAFGHGSLVTTELGSNTASARKRVFDILEKAWDALGPKKYERLAEVTKRSIEAALRATGPSKRIDLVHDLASTAVYDVLVDVFGTPGPTWLTELGVALPFSHQHVGELQPDWLTAAQAAAKAGTPDNLGLASIQIWSILMTVDLIGNYEQQPELMALSGQAASEMLGHLGMLIAQARAKYAEDAAKFAQSGDKDREELRPPNLLAAFVFVEKVFVKEPGYSSSAYYADVRAMLLELVGTTMANIPTTFAAVMDAVLKFNIPLPELIPVLQGPPMFPLPDPPAPPPPPEPEDNVAPSVKAKDKDAHARKLDDNDGVARLIYEACRLNGLIKILMRICEQDDELPSRGKVKAGDVVAALTGAAAFDERVFPDSKRLSLWPFLPGPERKIENYLLFGAWVSNPEESRDCWGRDKLALLMVKECVKAAGRLQHLQRVAGDAGNPKTIAHITIGLAARFSGVLPDWPGTPRRTYT
jgi:Dyp-type peroxidase family